MHSQQLNNSNRIRIEELVNEAWENHDTSETNEAKTYWANHAFDLLGELPENQVTLTTAQ